MSSTIKPLIEIDSLSIDFIQSKNSYVHAVKKVDLQLFEGKCTAIIGSSGAGKSLTSNCINGLIHDLPVKVKAKKLLMHDDGHTYNLLTIKSNDWLKIRGAKIGTVFQDPMSALNPTMKCGLQIKETLLNQGYNNKEAEETTRFWLKEFEFDDLDRVFNAYPHQLSGGQLQRIALAIAFCCKPKLIIADEPTSALDTVTQASFLKLLNRIKQLYNISILLIHHDLNLVKSTADDIYIMNDGEIIEHNITSEIFKHPVHPYTKKLLGAFENIKHNSNQEFSSQNPTILKVSDLHFERKKRKWLFKKNETKFSLDKINFEIKEGEFIGIAGRSGCGKSTLSKIIAKLLLWDDGNIYFKNRSYDKEEIKRGLLNKDKIQIIFQDPSSSLNPRMTVHDTLYEALSLHKKAETRDLIEMLQKVGLNGDYLKRYPHELSGGQRQRISIARALCTDPDVLICDEIVANLDILIQSQIIAILNELNQSHNLTIIFITHDLRLIRKICSRTIIMENGRITDDILTDELFENPQSQASKDLINAML
ncbi:MAG: ABC transporter ATP-binding protein [Saprospiraceae bacterium]|nr:ABC transporter ATP-binding protein [Saprospiraceae bacterium]